MKFGLIFGTRPEAIKMAPLYLELKKRDHETCIIATGQHRQMLDQVLEIFSLKADFDLNVMKERQSLAELTSRLSERLDLVLKENKFDCLLVQGDTTSTFIGALVSFYNNVKVGHVEAGLRSFDMKNPFPEEANRKLTSSLADFHFAPTVKSAENLLSEKIPPEKVFITGNTVIDSLFWVLENKKHDVEFIRDKYSLKNKKYMLMTMHRRENWGEPMKNVLRALKRVLSENPDINVVFPVHLNPAVREVVFPALLENKRVILTDPVEYVEFISLMKGSSFIISDSGGVQEEAPALGKPVLVLRKTTERPEAVESGTAKLIGTQEENVYLNISLLINDEEQYAKMAEAGNPFGDGKASSKIVDILTGVKDG